MKSGESSGPASGRTPATRWILCAAFLALAAAGSCSPRPAAEKRLEHDLVEKLYLARATADGSVGGSPAAASAETLPVPAAPRATTAGDALFVPYGTRLDYHLRLPAGSVLAVAAVRIRGDRPGRLELELLGEEGAALRLPEGGAAVDPGEKPIEIPLTADRSRIARLSLRAVPSTTGSPGSRPEGLLLLSPAVWSPAPRPAAAAGEGFERPRPPQRPNILVYLVDALRADHLGCYGYPKPISPSIDRFARQATLYERAMAQSSWTRPAVASLFTGLWPHVHGANGRRGKLSEEALTLAEILAAAGYRTAAFVTNPNVSPPTGLGQGFGEYRWLRSAVKEWTRADELNEAVFEWLPEKPTEEPFFLYVHAMDPHDPYDPTPEFRGRFAAEVPEGFSTIPRRHDIGRADSRAHYQALYDAEIAFADLHFGRLLDALRERGLYEDTLLVFLSDHGEEFAEHNRWTHGHTLLVESVHVPLIIRYPGSGGGLRIAEPVEQIDLLPTILDYLGVEPPSVLPGRSLLPLLAGGGGGPERQILTYLHLRGLPSAAVMEGRWKLIEWRRGEQVVRSSFFDTLSDPGEHRDVAGERPVVAGYLAASLEEKLRQEGKLPVGEAVLGEEIESHLRALGYLD